jgi:signal transduction histidine kinase
MFALNIANVMVSISAALLSLTLAWVLYRKKSGERMVVFLSFFLLLFSVGIGPLETLTHMWFEYPWFGSPILASLLYAPPFLFLMFLFPDGRFVPSWTRWLVILSIPIILAGYALEALIAKFYANIPGEIGSYWSFAVGLTALFAQVYRYRVVSGPDERQQTKWVIYGLSLMFTFMGVSSIGYPKMLGYAPGSPVPWWVPVAVLMYTLSLTFLPISLTIAVMRYRLYDIDIIINRTLVYGVLTAIVIGLYVLVVGAVSLGVQSNGNMVGALLATVLVGALFKPLRTSLQRAVDQVMLSRSEDVRQLARLKVSDDPRAEQGFAAPVPLTERVQRIVRLSWRFFAILAGGILIASIPGYVHSLRSGLIGNLYLGISSKTNFTITLAIVIISILTALLSLVLAWVLHRKKPGDRIAVYLSFFLLYYGVGFVGPIEMLGPVWPELSAYGFPIIASLFGPLFIALIVLFPNGRFVPSWARWLVILSIPIIPLGYAFETSIESVLASPLAWLGIFWGLGVAVLALFVLFYRYRVVSSQVERQQTKWVVYGLLLMFLSMVISTVPYAQMKLLPPGSSPPVWLSIATLIWSLSLTFLPVSLTIAVLRYRLYDIDVLINRTLVYGTLTASTMAIYVFIVGYLGNLLQAQDKSFIAFITTGLVAIVFQPMRRRLQRIINRMMYGDRDDPFIVISKLSKHLEAAIHPETILPNLVETVAQALKLPYVAIEVSGSESGMVIAEYGEFQEELERFPLIHQAETIGQLVVACRAPGESFNDSECRLLRNIAQQVGASVHAIQLTTDLQRSHQRLVTAREEERRRLRRDLHDGLGPVLASQGLKMAAASQLLITDPARAGQILDELAIQNESTVAEIRRLVYALRPAALDELGLVGALRDYAAWLTQNPDQATSVQVNVHQPECVLSPLSAAIEVNAYRIATEALTNVSRHSQAQNCTVSLKLEVDNGGKMLHLTIVDDGVGLPNERKPGVGLTSMHERAEEIGGSLQIESTPGEGTRVVARLPLLD